MQVIQSKRPLDRKNDQDRNGQSPYQRGNKRKFQADQDCSIRMKQKKRFIAFGLTK